MQPPQGETIARVPVARLIDSDRYDPDAPDPNVTLDIKIGLAEFANANFFSEDTLNGQFPFPRRADLVANPRVAPRSSNVRAYFSKRGPGLPTAVAVAECLSERSIGRWVISQSAPYPCVDEAVWEETATHMLPRAVGYARGVLDYFFRMNVQVRRVYTQSGNEFIQIENLGEEDLEGVFETYGRPFVNTPDERREKSGIVNGGAMTVIAAGSIVTLPLTLVPVANPTALQMLVFRGRHGLEEESVGGQIFTVGAVLVNETANTAFVRSSCSTNTVPLRTTCTWLPVRQEIDGELLTGGDTRTIRRIYAVWSNGTKVGLDVDGVAVPNNDWLRTGDEPDPKQFRIRPGGNIGTRLFLTVELMDAPPVITEMTHYITATTNAGKRSQTGVRPFYVVADRNVVEVRVAMQAPFHTVSIAGFPNPTSITLNRFGHPDLTEPTTVVDRPNVFDTRYSQRWIDFAQVFPNSATVAQVQAVLNGLSWGPPPAPPWEAVVERVYQAEELDFLKNFIVADPPADPIVIRAVDVAGT